MNESPIPIREVRIAFAAVVLAMLPAVLDQTILATALPTIAHDLGRLTDVSWVIAAYVVTAAASTPLWGKLGDRLGRKRLLETSLVLFLAASAVCGAAQDMTWLIVSRAAQGVAAGGLMTLAMAAVGDLVSPRERGRYQGYIAVAFALATVVGPLIGGVLVEHASWRWVFYVNLPLGAAALTGLYFKLPGHAIEAVSAPQTPLDVAGTILLAGSTIALMLACIWGGDRYAWGSPTIVALIAGGVALALALVARERRAPDPIVPLNLLRMRPVAVSSVALFLTTAALFSITVFVPLYLQTTTHATPTQAGLLLVPMMIGITVSTNLAGLAMSKTGRYKRYPIIGLALMTVALVLLAALAPHPSRTGHRDRAGGVRAGLRDGRPGADRGGPEQRSPAAARDRDGHHDVLPRARRRGRGGRPRRDLRRAHRRRHDGRRESAPPQRRRPRRRDPRRPGGVPDRGADRRGRADRRAPAQRSAATGTGTRTGRRRRAGTRPLMDEVRNTASALARRSRSIGSSRAPSSAPSSAARVVPGRIRPSAGGVISASPSTIQTFA